MTGPAAPRVAPGCGSSSCSPRGANLDPARREAHREPPNANTSLFTRDQGSTVPNYGCPGDSIRVRNLLLFPSPYGAVLRDPERWGRYKGVEVTEKG